MYTSHFFGMDLPYQPKQPGHARTRHVAQKPILRLHVVNLPWLRVLFRFDARSNLRGAGQEKQSSQALTSVLDDELAKKNPNSTHALGVLEKESSATETTLLPKKIIATQPIENRAKDAKKNYFRQPGC